MRIKSNIVILALATGALLLIASSSSVFGRRSKPGRQSCPREDHSKWSAGDSDGKQIAKDLKYLNKMIGGGTRSDKEGDDEGLPFDLFDWLCLTGIMPNAKKCFQLLSINKMEEWKMMRCCGVMKVECPASVNCFFNVVCPNTIRKCDDRR